MSETKYIRRGKIIETVEKDEKGNPKWQKNYFSLNKAKQASRKIQMDEDKALGMGVLRKG